jgi:hypothetical protein
MEQEAKNINNLEIAKRKLAIMVAGRLRKKENLEEAIEIQDRLSKKSGSWNSTEEIRKWREKK